MRLALLLACTSTLACAHHAQREFGPREVERVNLSQPRDVHGGTYFFPLERDPIINVPTLVEAELSHPPKQLTLELCDPDGRVLASVPMQPDDPKYGGSRWNERYHAPIQPPPGPFTLYVRGITQHGAPFRHRGGITYTGQVLDITMPAGQDTAYADHFDYPVTITNHGAADRFQIEVDDGLQLVTAPKNLQLALAPNQPTPITIQLTIPPQPQGTDGSYTLLGVRIKSLTTGHLVAHAAESIRISTRETPP